MIRTESNMKTLIIFIISMNAIMSVTANEAEVIALTLLGEARGEGKAGMYAVACVIKQRSINRNLSLKRICLERKQFSCWNGKSIRSLRPLLHGANAPYAMRIARHLAAEGTLDLGWNHHADHYCTIRTKPYWAKGKRTTHTRGNHKFYKLK